MRKELILIWKMFSLILTVLGYFGSVEFDVKIAYIVESQSDTVNRKQKSISTKLSEALRAAIIFALMDKRMDRGIGGPTPLCRGFYSNCSTHAETNGVDRVVVKLLERLLILRGQTYGLTQRSFLNVVIPLQTTNVEQNARISAAAEHSQGAILLARMYIETCMSSCTGWLFYM